MTALVQTIQHQQAEVQLRLFSFEVARLAEQLIAQSGVVLPRPLPEDWLRRALDVHQAEFEIVGRYISTLWDSQANVATEATD